MADETGFEAFCNLSETELRERIATLRHELLPLVTRAERLPGGRGIALAFDDTPERRRQLEHIVELERRCCSGLEWHHDRAPDAGELRLTVEGLAADAPLFAQLGLPPD